MAFKTRPVRVKNGILRRIWSLIFFLQRRKVQWAFQFIFFHCGVPRYEKVDKIAAKGSKLPQTYPAWIADTGTAVRRRRRNSEYQSFDSGDGPSTYRSELLGHIHPAPKKMIYSRLGQSLLAPFHTGASKHFGWAKCVLTHTKYYLECRWCSPTSLSQPGPPAPVVHSFSSYLVASHQAGINHLLSRRNRTRPRDLTILRDAEKAP